jgi:hypothetical protein
VSSTFVPRPVRIVCLALLALLAWGATAARAQTDFMVYHAKFTCGFAGGQIPDSGSQASVLPVPYREVQPGNYSTAINILNARFNGRDSFVNVAILTEGRPSTFIPSFTMTSFTTVSIDCDDITARLATVGFQNDGRFVEGFVKISARDQAVSEGSDLEVSAVYTYGSRRSDNAGTGLGSSIDVEHIVGKPEVQPE